MHWRGSAVGVLLASVAVAQTEPLFGDGHQGPLTIASRVTPNVAMSLAADVQAGAATLFVTSALGLSPGDLLLVHQHSGALGLDAGAQGALDVRASGAGRIEWVRVSGVRGTSVDLVTPVTQAFPAQLSQVVRVLEPTDVTVLDGGVLSAPPWNGANGGVLAILCTGTFTNHGLVTAVGAGFRGGLFNSTLPTRCLPDEPAGAGQGESVDVGRYGSRGAGNVANGGGGVCAPTYGGAGGSHVGKGGNTEGMPGASGGAPVINDGVSGFLFGGGGGASGHLRGGNGGGVIIVRCPSIIGAGQFTADGDSGEGNVISQTTQGSGGGGGGTLHLRAQSTLLCRSASASGGAGGPGGWGNAMQSTGGAYAGGGGGGGVVLLQGSQVACSAGAVAGVATSGRGFLFAGGEYESATDARGVGLVRLEPTGLSAPAAPSITEPRTGAVLTSPRVRVEGLASGQQVTLYAGARSVGSFPAVDGGFRGELDSLAAGVVALSARTSTLGVESGPSATVVVTVAPVVEEDGGADAGVDAGAADAGADSGVADAGVDAGVTIGLLPTVSAVARCEEEWTELPPSLTRGGFRVEALNDEPLPQGLSVDEQTGRLTWTPTRTDRAARFVLAQTTERETTRVAVAVTVRCQLEVACEHASGALLWPLLVSAAAWARRRR